jgi:putative SOS response-associated peptidase YedK
MTTRDVLVWGGESVILAGARPAAVFGDPAICNDFEQRIAYDDYVRLISDANWRAPPFEDAGVLAPVDHVRITDPAAVIRAEGDYPKLAAMRWSFPPANPKAGPVFNFRSEGRRFSIAQRCLIPASAFYEFTTAEDPKQKRKDRRRFERVDGQWLAIAGLWKAAHGNQPPVFTLLTCDPGPDIAAHHNRQVVVLDPVDWRPWLYGTKSEAEVLKPSAVGVFQAALG